MTAQTMQDVMTRKPFQAFRVILSSGQSYDVSHPEVALLTRNELIVGVGEQEEGIPARFKICALLHITTVESMTAAPK